MRFKEYKTILSSSNGMNIYRGCNHGCIYCDSRSKCYQIEGKFDDVEAKLNAPEILDLELRRKKEPVMIGTGAMSDPYNHDEEKLLYTRKCLEVILKHHCGIAIQTKSDLILRDIDLIDSINKDSKAVVAVTLTTADDNICKIIEPDVCPTSRRIRILEECLKRNIPSIVWLCPFLPYINDTKENIEELMNICIKYKVKGIIFFGVGVTLREGNREYFYEALDRYFPGLKEKYIKQYKDSYEVLSNNNYRFSQYIINRCIENNILMNEKAFEFCRKYPESFTQLSIFD